MADYLKTGKKRYILSVLIALSALVIIAGVGYAFTPSYILQIGGGDGFLSNVDPEADENAPLRVIDFQVGKTDIASETEIEVEAIVANYGNEEKEDVVIKPVLTSMDGSTDVSDGMDIRPKEQYEIDSFKPGSIRTFRYYIEFEHDPQESGQEELEYKLKLTDEDGDSDISDIKQSERVVNILPEGSSTAGSRFIDREPFSISTFPVDKYKDKFVDERDVIGADRSIPPVNKDSNGDISEVDVAEGEVSSYGALTQTDTRNSGEIFAANGEMRIGFGFESIPTREHYVLRLAHEDQDIEEDVELDLVDSRGEEIDKNSTYMVSGTDGEIEQFDYHLTGKEVDHIRGQGDVYVVAKTTNDGATNDVDINNAYYLSLLGVNRVVDLPESDLNVTSIEPVDGNYQIVNGRPTYGIDEKMEIQVEIKNEGDGSYSGDLGLEELNQGFTSARSVNRSTVINPNQTRVYNFETEAVRPGTHSYVVKDESLCSSDIECPLQLQVRESSDDIVPRIETESPNIIAEETARFELDGVFSSDYNNIDSIKWTFEDDERNFNDAANGVDIDYEFADKGRKTVSVEVEYTIDGQSRTAEHSIFVDVIERPLPEINAVYYDIKAADRGGTRTGEQYGPGISGTIMSGSCEGQCGGEMSIAGISPQMTDGLSMMVVDKKFASDENSDIVHYGTYDFEENQYATNDGSEFSGSLEDALEPGAVPRFIDDVSEHSGEGKIFIFAGGGDPSIPIDVESELERMGAKFGGYDSAGDNVSYTFITESQGSGDYKPMHESYLPPSTGQQLRHSVGIVPVEASDSNVPKGQEVYLDVTDEKGSNYYDELDDSQISYNWGGSVDSRGDHAYIVPSSSISTSVSLGLDTISDDDQQASKTVPVGDEDPSIRARAMNNVIQDGGQAVFTAAYSYDPDDQIDPTNLDWSVDSPSGTSVVQSNTQSKQSISLVGGETPGTIEATLLYEGEEVDTAEIQLITEAEARFEFDRVSGSIDHDRGSVSTSETPIYSYGQTENSNSLSELELSAITGDVSSTFGNGFVAFNENRVNLFADSTSGTSASRFVQTNELDLGPYDSVYVSYQRTISSQSNSPSGEVGYVSAHTGEISQDKFTYGEKGTLRGSDTDIPMISDVVTSEESNTRYGVMELDVSDVSSTDSVTVHARANAENNAVTSVNIYEVWAGGRDSTAPVSQMFDSNMYPSELSENVQYISSRKGLGFKSLGGADGSLQSKSFSSDFLEARYNFPSEGSNDFSISTGGIDVTSGLNTDSVRTESAGSSASITGGSSNQPVIIDSVVTEVESSNTNNPIVVLDGRSSAALPEDDYSWSASNPSAVDIKNPDSIRTIAEFTSVGEHEITLSVDSSFGSSTETKTVQVDSVAPDVSLEMPSNAEVGDSVPINVENSADSNVQETIVMFGNGEKETFDGTASTSYSYSNPGTYQVTVVSRDSNGLTSADSKRIKVGTLGVQVVDSLSEQVFLPNDAYFDATGTASVPSEAEPAKLIDISNLIENEDDMSYTWEAPDGSTSEGSTYLQPVDSEGTDNINLIVEGPAGSTETMNIELQKDVAIPTIQALSVTRDPIQTFEPFNVQYSVNQPSGVDAQLEVNLNDGSDNVTGTITGSSNSELPASINTENRNPGDLPDTYNVELFVENQYSETAYDTTEIQVERGPKADFQLIGTQPFTVGSSVSMDASESVEPYGNDLTYEWTFYDGENTETLTRTGDSTIQYAFSYVSDSTNVELTVTDSNGDTDTVERSVSIDSDAVAGISANSIQRTGNTHEFEFDASSSAAGGVNNNIETYRFDFDNDGSYEQTSNNPVVTHAYEESGEFTAVVEVEDTYGSTATASTTVTSEPGVFTEPVRLNTCGNQQGRVGPTQSDCDSEYSGTELEGSVNVYEDGIQELELPVGGYYRIETVGAGYSGGSGAQMEGIVNINSGTTLQVAVGQQGGNNGGAGGTFVAQGSSYTSASELIVAGGGAKGSNDGGSGGEKDANTGESGNDGYGSYPGTISGGTNGNGGSGADGTGGGGFYSDGGGGQDTSQGGYAFQNGAVGAGADINSAFGGFGGGGVTENGGDEPGGGGGYSGGGGADDDPPEYGGGGGSYLSDSFIYSTSSVGNSGPGYVELQFIGQELPNIESCQDLQDNGVDNSGNYLIYPNDQPIEVYCDMNYDGGGWTRMDVSTAKQFVDNIGGGITQIDDADGFGYDGDRPYAYDEPYAGDEQHFVHYDVNTGFSFDEIAVESLSFTAQSNRIGGSTSETHHTGSYMGSWANNANAGNIVWGSAADSQAVDGYENGDRINCGGCTDTWDPSQGSKVQYNLDSSSTTFRIGMGEAGYQGEGWRWESGRIYFR